MYDITRITPRAAIASAIVFLLLPLFAPAPAAADCDSGEDCFCECTNFRASAQGEGPCAVVEKEGEWCSIAYSGNTGSVGPKSRAPMTVTSTSTTLFRGLPDHRTEEYARRTREVKNVIARGRMPSEELQDDALVILARAAYVSAPWITAEEIAELDRALDALMREKPDTARVFFAPADPRLKARSSAPSTSGRPEARMQERSAPTDTRAQPQAQAQPDTRSRIQRYQVDAADLRLTRVGEWAKVRAGYVEIKPRGSKLRVDVIWKDE